MLLTYLPPCGPSNHSDGRGGTGKVSRTRHTHMDGAKTKTLNNRLPESLQERLSSEIGGDLRKTNTPVSLFLCGEHSSALLAWMWP